MHEGRHPPVWKSVIYDTDIRKIEGFVTPLVFVPVSDRSFHVLGKNEGRYDLRLYYVDGDLKHIGNYFRYIEDCKCSMCGVSYRSGYVEIDGEPVCIRCMFFYSDEQRDVSLGSHVPDERVTLFDSTRPPSAFVDDIVATVLAGIPVTLERGVGKILDDVLESKYDGETSNFDVESCCLDILGNACEFGGLRYEDYADIVEVIGGIFRIPPTKYTVLLGDDADIVSWLVQACRFNYMIYDRWHEKLNGICHSILDLSRNLDNGMYQPWQYISKYAGAFVCVDTVKLRMVLGYMEDRDEMLEQIQSRGLIAETPVWKYLDSHVLPSDNMRHVWSGRYHELFAIDNVAVYVYGTDTDITNSSAVFERTGNGWIINAR